MKRSLLHDLLPPSLSKQAERYFSPRELEDAFMRDLAGVYMGQGDPTAKWREMQYNYSPQFQRFFGPGAQARVRQLMDQAKGQAAQARQQVEAYDKFKNTGEGAWSYQSRQNALGGLNPDIRNAAERLMDRRDNASLNHGLAVAGEHPATAAQIKDHAARMQEPYQSSTAWGTPLVSEQPAVNPAAMAPPTPTPKPAGPGVNWSNINRLTGLPVGFDPLRDNAEEAPADFRPAVNRSRTAMGLAPVAFKDSTTPRWLLPAGLPASLPSRLILLRRQLGPA